jgi:hypothetical protein
MVGVPAALAQAKEIYVAEPSLRASVLNYLSRLPFSKAVGTTFIQLLEKTDLYDDVTRFGFVAAIVKWEVPRSALGLTFAQELKVRLEKTAKASAFDWLCLLVFLAKYGEAHEVLSVAQAARIAGAKEPFFARQRMAVLTRGLGINRQSVRRQWRTEASTGYSDSASVATNLLHFSSDPFPSARNRLYLYLFPTKEQRPYPLPKFLLLCALASGEAERGKKAKRPEVSAHVRDPWYQHWLAQIHPPWF